MDRPNILFVFSDQQRSTTLGCAGVEAVQTPNLDAFAAQGTRFTRAISNSPICCPARATLLSGMYALSHGVVTNDLPLRTDFTSMAHALGDAGYRCGYIGKWHLDGPDRAAYTPPGPRRQGFDDYWAVANCNHNYLRGYYYEDDDDRPVWIDGYEPDTQTDLAIRYMESRAGGDDPFCLALSWGPPHCPYRELPEESLARYDPADIVPMPSAAPHAAPELIAGYYAHCTALDHCWGRLMSALDRLDIADNTLVVYTSDHGDMLFNHDRGWKSKPWRESANVPLLVRWPGHVPAGRVSDGVISWIDLYPTLATMVGAEVPGSVQGSDLSEFVLGATDAGAESAWLLIPHTAVRNSFSEWRGVITRTHTYARQVTGPWLLFDDVRDPFQMENLVDHPDHAARRADLDRLIDTWLERTGDSFETSEQLIERMGLADACNEEGIYPFWENEPFKAARAAHFDKS